MTRRVYIHTFGCQMNKLDSELVADSLSAAGHEIVAEADQADVILFNTCSVRQHAEDKVYSHVGALKARKRREPGLIVGVLGCMAEKDGKSVFGRAPHVDVVCGPRQMAELPKLIDACSAGETRVLAGGPGAKALDRTERASQALQAYVAIVRGCNNFCSYCVVPHLRGPEVDRPAEEIVAEVKQLAESGVKELTLLGQNVNSYGQSLDRPVPFAELLAMVDDVAGLRRIRFVTNHPKDMSEETLAAIRDLDKVCEHIHVPAQSGSDKILRTMNRNYTSGHYRELLDRARSMIPGVGIASDFIVGFAGETHEDFEETHRLIQDARFHNCFIFKYSPRPRTAAAELEDNVPDEAKRERNQVLLKTQEQINIEEHAKLVGTQVEVLATGPSRKDHERWTGRTRANRIIVFPGEDTTAGELVTVRIESYTPLTLFGRKV